MQDKHTLYYQNKNIEMLKSKKDIKITLAGNTILNLLIALEGPLLVRYLYNDLMNIGRKCLEMEFLRYCVTSKERGYDEKTGVWILDSILNDCFEKRLRGEPFLTRQGRSTPRAENNNF